MSDIKMTTRVSIEKAIARHLGETAAQGLYQAHCERIGVRNIEELGSNEVIQLAVSIEIALLNMMESSKAFAVGMDIRAVGMEDMPQVFPANSANGSDDAKAYRGTGETAR